MLMDNWINKSRIRGNPTTALTVALKARGCSYAKKNRPCKFCSFHRFAEKDPKMVTPQALKAQLLSLLRKHKLEEEGVEELRIYNGGSLFADEEITPEERKEIFSTVVRYPFRRLLIESRPEFVERKKVQEAKRILGEMELEVAIGLETADDALRARLRKGFTREDFEKAVCILAEFGVDVGVYLLLKPVLMSEEEAKEDALASLLYLAELREKFDVRVVARLEPFVLYKDTAIAREYLEAGYRPLQLWTVAEIIESAPEVLELFVGEIEDPLNVVLSRQNHDAKGGYCASSDMVEHLIKEFNSTGNKELLRGLKHKWAEGGRER
jgi:radical SAM enzyme (TIGR01210 family)